MFGKSKSKASGLSSAKRIYLDHASATPVLPEVLQAMLPYFADNFGNASAIHTEGQRAKLALTRARAQVAKILQIQPTNVTFTGSGTESNNLAIVGSVDEARSHGLGYHELEIITTKIEHPATLRTVEHLSSLGVTVHYAPVDSVGKILLTNFHELLTTKTILVTVAYVNSEIGTIEDIGALARIITSFNTETGSKTKLHVDAAQAPVWLPCGLPRLGADLLSLDGGKFGGPKGVGVLARAKHIPLENISFGGAQENGLRPGTENVANIVGLATALEIAQTGWQERQSATTLLRDYFILELKKVIKTLVINGAEGPNRVANNINISIAGLDSEFAVVTLDVAGVACSTKSACSSAGGGDSTVVKEISSGSARASSTLRFTLGSNTTKTEIDFTVSVLKKHITSNQLL